MHEWDFKQAPKQNAPERSEALWESVTDVSGTTRCGGEGVPAPRAGVPGPVVTTRQTPVKSLINAAG